MGGINTGRLLRESFTQALRREIESDPHSQHLIINLLPLPQKEIVIFGIAISTETTPNGKIGIILPKAGKGDLFETAERLMQDSAACQGLLKIIADRGLLEFLVLPFCVAVDPAIARSFTSDNETLRGFERSMQAMFGGPASG